MVKNIFEQTVVETLMTLKEGQASFDTFAVVLKSDVDEIKRDVKDISVRTNKLEESKAIENEIKKAQIKTRGMYIKVIGIALGSIGSIFTVINVIHLIR